MEYDSLFSSSLNHSSVTWFDEPMEKAFLMRGGVEARVSSNGTWK